MISQQNDEQLPTSKPLRSSSKRWPKSTTSTDRPTIRGLSASDIEQVAALWLRCFRASEEPPTFGLKRYFREVMLDNPWFDPQVAPLVMEQAGEVVGFVGRYQRPMRCNGQAVRVAVASQLMVDPRRKLGFAALELIRAVQTGPQDLTFSDGAGEQAVHLWTRCGGSASRLLSFEWVRPLRPLANLAARLRSHARVALPARLARPFATLADNAGAAVVPSLYRKPRLALKREDASIADLLPLLERVASTASLHPVYTPKSYSWLLQKAAESIAFGPMQTRLVRNEDGAPVGWFIYYVRPHEAAQVLQVGAIHGFGQAVISELFRDAWEQDAIAVTGALDPLLLIDLSNSHARFRCASIGVLVHARNPQLLATVERGDAFLSRLEGEWWMRFGVDRRLAW